MQIGYVYKITNPEEAIYVGSTKSFKKRIVHYKCLNCKGQRKVYESLLKYGYENHKIEIICEVPVNEMKKVEREMGLFFNVLDSEKGLNFILPAYGDLKEILSDEWKESHRKRSLNQVAKQLKLESKIKMSINSKRVKPSVETKMKAKIALARPVIQFDKNGNKLKEFDSTADASKYTGIGRTSIKNNLNGLYNSAGGYVWRFKYGNKKGINHKKIIQKDMNGNVIKIHDSISQAARSIKVDYSSIRYVVKGKGVTAGGYKWELYNQEGGLSWLR